MIKKNLDVSLFKNKTITVATPMSGGVAFTGYIRSVIELTKICAENNIDLDFTFIFNESLITRGRNHLTHLFLKSNRDYLFFIDADISFDPLDLLYMVQLATLEKDKQIICAVYPKKHINWDFIKKAEDFGLVKNKEDYKKYQSEFVLNYVTSENDLSSKNIIFNTEEPLKVYQSGTGFMLISKDVFYKFKEKYPEQTYLDLGDGEEKVAFFDCKINPENKVYMSEDYMFCDYADKISIPTWILPWVSLNHSGTFEFSGNFKEYSEELFKIMN